MLHNTENCHCRRCLPVLPVLAVLSTSSNEYAQYLGRYLSRYPRCIRTLGTCPSTTTRDRIRDTTMSFKPLFCSSSSSSSWLHHHSTALSRPPALAPAPAPSRTCICLPKKQPPLPFIPSQSRLTGINSLNQLCEAAHEGAPAESLLTTPILLLLLLHSTYTTRHGAL
ncbi:hypothetical protein LX36DRAFT_15771 [Colletotrichum falcatum]|nr:hypothetical protein LX36DRAFT_15771 [Colletotrichum falcatum]